MVSFMTGEGRGVCRRRRRGAMRCSIDFLLMNVMRRKNADALVAAWSPLFFFPGMLAWYCDGAKMYVTARSSWKLIFFSAGATLSLIFLPRSAKGIRIAAMMITNNRT